MDAGGGLTDERRRAPALPRPFGRRTSDRVTLTERQREVLEHVAQGLENKEIAARLDISEQGVKQQVSVLLRKFRAPSRAVLARTALTMKLLGTADHGADVPLEYLFDRAPLLIAMSTGPELELVLVNRAVRELFGDREYIGRTLREAFSDVAAGMYELLVSVQRTGQAYRSNEQLVRFQLPDGTPREAYLSFIAEPRRAADGAVDGVVFYGWDITESVRMREELQRLTLEQRTLLEQLPVGVIYTDERARPVLVNGVARRMLGATFDPERPLYETLIGWNLRFASTGIPIDISNAPSARAIAGWPFDDEVIVSGPAGTRRVHVSARPLHDERGAVTGAALVLTEREADSRAQRDLEAAGS